MEIVGKGKPIMFIGPTGSGKSTLIKALNLREGEVKKTESVTYLPYAIDTPGEMVHLPFLYNALILNSTRASLVLFLMSAKRYPRLPSKIALALKVPSVGIVSQIDGAEAAGIRRAAAALSVAGLKTIFNVSSVSGEGIATLREFLLDSGVSLG
ncbi:MAG: EutP/PduV family microcompartment system protein [Spirochaetaceae bacterium]|jgi:ethanolamine utilization protein EutP|nr:EutP/PduV family microcompartment system protein [Spirochaetaceae bacterium]